MINRGRNYQSHTDHTQYRHRILPKAKTLQHLLWTRSAIGKKIEVSEIEVPKAGRVT